MTPDLTLPYDGVSPEFAGRPAWCGRGSAVIGAARIGAGAWIGDGAVIEAGQILGSGHLWGGRPAHILAPLDAGRRATMARFVECNRRHGRAYQAAQAVSA